MHMDHAVERGGGNGNLNLDRSARALLVVTPLGYGYVQQANESEELTRWVITYQHR